MNYFECSPSLHLRSFIKCYWFLADASPLSSVQTIVPDGRSELVFNLAQPFQSQGNQGWHSQPECFFVGQITRPFLVRPNGAARILGVRFHPHGANQLLGLPVMELTESVVSIQEVAPRLYQRLEHLRNLRSLDQQLAALDRIMLVTAQPFADQRVSFAVSEFERAGGLIRIRDLADQIGMSTRQFERLFKTQVGISPKVFGRLQRFQRVLQATDKPDPNWVSAAIDCGYYDQAHLIRDFRQFTGITPTASLTEEFDLARIFMRR